MLFTVVFLQFLYNLSDRQVEEQINLHLACKWFVGRELAEPQADGPTAGGRLWPAQGNIVPGGRHREVREARQGKPG